MKNLLNNLLNWVLKKGPSETEKDQAWEEKGSTRVWEHVAMFFAVLVMSMANIGMAWGEDVTWNITEANVTTLTATQGASITIGSGSKQYSVHAVRGGGSNKNSDSWVDDVGMKFGDGNLYKSGIAVYVPTTSNNISSISFYMKKSADKARVVKYYAADAIALTSEPSTSTQTLTTSFAPYSPFSSPAKGKYYIVGGYTGGSGDVYLQKVVVTFADAAPSTKRIYMKAGAWNTDSPYFYAHSWGSSNSDVLMTLASCESDVFYADIPSGNTSVLFTRQSTNSGIKYKDQDGNWNQSLDITISTNDLFTFNSWDGGDGKSSFTGGTYSAPTYTISYAANSGSGSMSSQTGIACGTDKATTANAFTRDGYSFTGWEADVDVKVGGSTKTAGTLLADGVTIQDISSNITLTAQWEEEVTYTVTYSLNGGKYNGSSTAPTQAAVASGTEITLPSLTPTKEGYVFASWKCSVGNTYHWESYNYTMTAANTTFTAQWVAAASLVSGTLYYTADIVPLSLNAAISATNQYAKGISSNGVFTSLGNPLRTSNSDGTMEINKKDKQTVDGYNFYDHMWFKGGPEKSGVVPSSRAVKFTIPSAGTLSIYCTRGDRILLSNGTTAKTLTSNTSGNIIRRDTTITAGTYYLYANNSGTSLAGMKFVQSCTAPSALAAATPTAKGITLSVTDANNVNNYEFYVSTSSTAPEAGATATHSVSSAKSLTITNLVAGTTYYAWARSVCGVSNKSGWTALGGGGTFTTSTVSADYHLTNVTKSSGATTGIGGSTFTAVFASVSGYALPSPVVTIDGNTATSGTDYTWTAGTGTLTINADKITGDIDITMSSPAAAPTNVAISGTYHYYPGETISLTATPTGGNGPVTYQWYHGGTADGDAIDGATSATFTKSNCVVGDAGDYYCKVTCGGSASRWSDGATEYTPFKVKIMQFLLKDSNGDDIGDPHALVKGADAQHASLILNLTGGTTYKFRVTDGCGNWYGNSDATGMTSSNCTNWTMPHNADCKMTTGLKTANYTFNFDFTSGLLGSEMKVSIVYPGGNQAADKVIYWDNSVLNWDDGDQWYRIGKSNHHSKTQMTKVFGTANLYKVTTAAYDGFEYWHIANNQGNGDGNLFWTKGDADKAITHAMAFEGAPVTLDAITITPTTAHSRGETSDNDNCEFYGYGTASGMKTQNVTISPYSNGTITVNYTNTSNVASTLTSGNADLAHTVILTSITAVANTGYDASAITINGNAYTANYVVTGATTIAASFTPHVYSITYKDQGNVAFSGTHTDTPSAHPTSHTYNTATNLNGATKAGYTFGGWYTSPDCSTGLVTSLGATDYTADITLYAKWTEEVAPTDVCWDPATTPADKLTNNTTTLTTLTSRFAAIDGVTSVTVDNPGTSTGQCAGSDDDSGYLKVKNATTTKIITIVTTAPTNITIGGKKYGDNTGSFYLVKSTDTENKLAECNTNEEDEATNLPAGTYYIYAKASTKSINFSKLCIELYECSTPAAPTAFANTAVTSTTATFSITDAADAASYDLYYASGSPSTPTAGTDATENVTTKTPTITGLTASTTYKIWVRSVCDADHKSAWVALGTTSFTTAATYSVTHSLTNVTATSGATGAGAATEGVAYNAVFTANTGYVLPSTITVTIGGSPAVVGTGYTWNASTGAFQVPAEQVTGAIVITIAGETAPATKDIYYGAITITAGALTKGSTGTVQFFTNTGGTIANNTEISLSTTLGAGSEYYLSNDLTGAELSKSSNWTTSSSSNRYVQGVKFGSGKSYTLALGSKVASSITFYGINGSASKTMTIGGQAWTSSSTKNTFAKHEFTKSGNFTGNVSITQDGDFYGILVITIQTATPCTTPVIPTLSNQTVCPGSDIAAWNATQTAVLADGETASYSWKKKGNDTELANTASFDLGSSAAESQAGTYVVTVTVSKAGKASATATKEVTLTVTAAVEEPVITANKATVYPGNSVTLTATCGTDGVTWNWYSCANADGTGAGSSLGTSSSYTIASAGAAGTYYYKAVATGSCGTAERVYTLTVTAASECENYFWFIDATDATANGVVNNRDGFFSNTTTGTSNAGTYTITIDEVDYTATKRLGAGAYKPKFTVPESKTATLYVYGKANSADAGRHLVIKRTSDNEEMEVTDNNTDAAYSLANIPAGEWTLSCGSNNWRYSVIAVKLCGASTCTDATPTITAVNNTVCSGTKMRIDATGYEAGATFKWQKLNTSTSSWDDVAGATLDSLVIASVTASNAGSYRFIATKGCSRTSNTVTITVPSAPVFGTVPASVTVMQTIALSINTVEATDAVKYRWYKSADPTWDAGDTEIGTNKELIKAYDGEAIGSPSYYIFCRAQNACGITTSTAIAVNVTAYVEEDCATRGNEVDAEFGFQNSGCGQGTYNSASCWTMNSNSKILVYSAPDDKYFKTMKVTIASSSASQASYNWSTDGGSSYTNDGVAITGVTTTLTEKTINLSAHGNVNEVKIGRNFGNGESSGTLYVSKICFEYTAACTATTVTPSTSIVNYEMGGGSFTEPTFTVKHGETAFDPQPTLSYSSSNEDIASVDDDGTVTFNGEAGTVTITASYAGSTISATEYCASSGSYTINVSCPGGAPKIVAASTVDLSGCNSSVTLHAKKQDGTAFEDGTYQWFRNGEEIDDATSSSYTATQAGTYTVERTNTSDCTTPSTNSAVVTSETTEPEVERLVPFQYYHVDKTYSDQMKMRHLFAVKNSGKLDGKHFKMYVSCNGGAATDVTSSNALVVVPNGDGHVDTVMVDLNKLSGKYNENDELVFTCKAIDCTPAVSEVYKNTITMNVIGATPTLALICSGSSKASGTRKTSELTVGGDFLTGYNVADLCQQTGNTSFDGNTEWGLYTDLKTQYIVTPVNGYAVFNKLNYEPFDILLLTDYPKASKSDAAATILDDMAALCDYRPMLSFKTHMVAKSPSKWAEKGFTTSPVVTKADGRLNLNIVCYAHPMFNSLKTGDDVYTDVGNTSAPLVYTMLSGTGYESSKGMQGFELAAAENFVTIGLTHYNGTIAKDGSTATWTPGSEDRMLVTVAERQANPEARFILFSLNCGAQSKLTDKGEEVVLACLNYLLGTAEGTIAPADCSFTFDDGEGNMRTPEEQAINCPTCPPAGDHKWNNPANWGPDYRLLPGEFTSVRIKKPVEVNDEHAHVMEVRIIDEGSIDIPAGKALDVKSTIRRQDGTEIYPTDVNDIHIGSGASGNGTLIFNNNSGDTKARVDMYSNAQAADPNTENSATNSVWQYIGTPHTDVANARSNYYGSWLYQYVGGTWTVIPNGGPLVAFRGYCITNETAPIVYDMAGTLVATTTQDIAIPAGFTVIANSWVAPIDINAITDDDMEGITDKTIYFFNTGTDAEGTAGTGTAAGTYRATPIHSASYTGDWQIPSMQGFYVSTTSAGTFHLDYERHVRPAGGRTIVSNPMYAPRRAAMSDEPEVAKLFFRGHRYHDKLVVLEREDFTRGYDSGWDGEAWGGSDLSPMAYVSIDGRYDAVSAVPEYEGTVIGFRAGEDNECTIDFEYSEENEPLYLYDTETKQYTRVVTGNAYHFTTSDKAYHERFILTRNNPQTPTDIGNGEASGGARAKKFILNDKMYIMINGLLYDATGKVVK